MNLKILLADSNEKKSLQHENVSPLVMILFWRKLFTTQFLKLVPVVDSSKLMLAGRVVACFFNRSDEFSPVHVCTI